MTRATASPPTGARWVTALWVVLAVGTAVLGSTAAGAPATASVLFATAATRAAMTVVGVACVGLALVGLLLPSAGAQARDAVATRRHADRSIVAVAGTWVVLALLGVAFRAAEAFGTPVTALDSAQLLRWTTQLAAGRGMLLTAGCALVVLGCAIVRLRDPGRVALRVPLVAALLGVLTPAVTGHASSAPDHQLAVVTIALHAGAAALWVGGLGALVALVAARRRLLNEAVARFSTLAGYCVVAVGITGLVNAQVRLESWAALLTTGYGALVLVKVGCVALLAWLGALARRRLAAGRLPVLRWAGLEVALMAVTLGVAAALTQTA